MQCVAVCRSVLQCVAVCCSVLQYDVLQFVERVLYGVLPCIEAYCSVRECVFLYSLESLVVS